MNSEVFYRERHKKQQLNPLNHWWRVKKLFRKIFGIKSKAVSLLDYKTPDSHYTFEYQVKRLQNETCVDKWKWLSEWCNEKDVKICVSSVWKNHFGVKCKRIPELWEDAFQLLGFKPGTYVGITETHRTLRGQEIQDWLDDFASYEDTSKHIKHIFFGANHSYNFSRPNWEGIVHWESMIEFFLKKDYLCSLDIPLGAVEEFNDGGLCEYNNFIPQIRVPIPYIKLWNYNTMIKIDDKDFKATNPGVWSHSLHSLMDRSKFTDWAQYKNDTVIK